MKKQLLTSLGLLAAAAMSLQAQSTLVNSWENSEEGWVIDEGNWTSGGFSTTTGVTKGTYSWVLNAANAPDYGAAFTGPASTDLTLELANAASVSVDVLATGFSGLSVDLVVNQGQSGPFGLGYQSADGYNYTGSPTIGTESTLTWTIPASFRQTLQDNPTLAANLVFQVGFYTGGGGVIYLDNLRITPLAGSAAPAPLYVRETWDGLATSVYPGYEVLSNDLSSVGFNPSVAWYGNPSESGANGTPTNTSLISIRNFINKPTDFGLPTTLAVNNAGTWSPNTPSTLCQDNSGGPKGLTTLWTAGDWMVRPMTQANAINFRAEGQYWFSFTYGDSQDAIYAGEVPSSGAGGIGISDGADTNANFVAFGITATNLYLGPAEGTNIWGTIDATKSVYISQGTLGQAGNPNSLIYSPANDPTLLNDILPNNSVKQNPITSTVQTNFTGGPYYVNAFGTNRQGQAFGNEILVLGHLTTHSNAPATMDAKFYNVANLDQLDTNAADIQWDCSYSFNYTNTMAYFLVFENGEFPFDIYDFHAGSTLASVVGIDPGFIGVSPLANTYVGYPIDMTCYSSEAPSSSNTNFPASYTGVLDYQWYQNGLAISGATSQTLDVGSASLSDSAMPAGTDAGTYTCVSTDSGGFWGSVTSAPVVVTVVPPIAPTIAAIQPYADLSTIQLVFNEPVNNADNLANYSISGGIVATSVVVVSAGQSTFAQLRTTKQAEGTKYTVTVSGVVNAPGQSVTPNTATFNSMMEGPGVVNFDAWSAVSAGSALGYFNAFLLSTPFPFIETNEVLNSWDGIGTINLTLYASGSGNFGGRQYGWFTAPATTNYVFFVAADDGARLSLSTDSNPANLCVIAAESLWSGSDQWTNFSNTYPTGPHRGDGSATGVAPGGLGWDNSTVEQSPATADDQNRSDQFVVAYNDSVNGSGNWPTATSQVTDVVPAGTTNLWPNLDANGQALIHLVAGQKYFLQCEYIQIGGGYDLTVTYKYAGAPDPASPSASLLTAGSGTISGMVPFAASPPTVTAGVDGNGKPVITFTGVLQSASNVAGPYTDVNGATSPYSPVGGTTFFRSHN